MDADEASGESTTIRLTEYQALRAEILKRFDIQHQLLSLAVIAAGTLFVAGIQYANPTVGALIILGYPVLSLFLAAGWGHHDRRVWQAATYIRERIEPKVGVDRLGWEHFHPASSVGPGLQFLAARGVFIGTQVFAILVGAFLARLDTLASTVLAGSALPVTEVGVLVFLVVGVGSVVLTIFALGRVR